MITFPQSSQAPGVITFSLVAFCAFWLTPSWSEGPLLFPALLRHLRDADCQPTFLDWLRPRPWGTIHPREAPARLARGHRGCCLSVLLRLQLRHSGCTDSRGNSTHLRLRSVLIEGAFSVWLVGSWVGFGLVMVFWTVDRAARAAAWVYRRARKAAAGHAAAPMPGAIALDPPSPARRRFLEQTAIALSATPFVAAAYGLLYGRLNVEVTRPRIRLARLPKAFEGFRIAQLSDFHISPFMPADEIRRCVTITNGLKADLVVLTGDYLA